MRIFKVWSQVNQAWFILFGRDAASASLLRVVSSRHEAEALMAEWNAS